MHALDNVSLDVREGEFLCILGPSGCGKTTLLWSMAGLHTLSSGEIRIGSEQITKPHPEIAMIFQDANLRLGGISRRTSNFPSRSSAGHRIRTSSRGC